MLEKDARQNLEETCTTLREVRQCLNNASGLVENDKTRDRIQNQITRIEQCFNECKDIANTLR